MSPNLPEGPQHPDSPASSSTSFTNPDPAMDALDILKRDRFELLSCYLDGEVSATERKEVESWLVTDPEIQQLHTRLLKLRHGFQNLPAPVTSQSADKTASEVFARIDRRPKLGLILGIAGTAVAVFTGALTGVLPGSQTFSPQVAERAPQAPASNGPEDLMLALERPPVDIPTNPTAKPDHKAPGDAGLYFDPSEGIR